MPKPESRLVYSERASADIERLSIYLTEKRGVQAAFGVVQELLSGIGKLEEMPHLGSPHPDTYLAHRGYLVLFVGRCACVYIVMGGTVNILGVFHQRSDWIAQFNPLH